MNILRVHNFYKQAGGEDYVHATEVEMLRSFGHKVLQLHLHNEQIRNGIIAFFSSIWSINGYRLIKNSIKTFRPDIVHIDNFFPLFSPSIYYACKQAGVPVVQTIHNYRLICPGALFLLKGAICERCLGKKFPWPSVINRCYRNSLPGSMAIALMIFVHWTIGTWTKKVDRYIVLSQLAKSKFKRAGFPISKFSVKPNFVNPDPGAGNGAGSFFIYVGRLTKEKGIDILLEAWSILKEPVELIIMGDGPDAEKVKNAAQKDSRIKYWGLCDRKKVLDTIGRARALIFPSMCYEGMPITIIEAFAKGTPVLASNIGAAFEMVKNETNGFTFEVGSTNDLTSKIKQFESKTRTISIMRMRENARFEYQSQYSIQKNYELLLDIYKKVIATKVNLIK
jgi:glycosyltransferase involved in cell wall biosynthesis